MPIMNRCNKDGGGQGVVCGEDKVISIDIRSWNWGCTSDEGQCPGLGGFKVGCSGGNMVPPPVFNCDTEVIANPFGECECPGQLFTNDQCDELFYCYNSVSTNGGEGCHLKCEDGKVALLDIKNKDWSCVERTDDFVCPGKFNTGCRDEDFAPECACDGEVWMNNDCSEAFICSGKKTGSTNPGDIFTCGNDEVAVVDLADHSKPYCSTDKTKCIGSYNLGCSGNSGVSLVSSVTAISVGVISALRLY